VSGPGAWGGYGDTASPTATKMDYGPGLPTDIGPSPQLAGISPSPKMGELDSIVHGAFQQGLGVEPPTNVPSGIRNLGFDPIPEMPFSPIPEIEGLINEIMGGGREGTYGGGGVSSEALARALAEMASMESGMGYGGGGGYGAGYGGGRGLEE